LHRLHIKHETFADASVALSHMLAGGADAIVYDQPVLKYLIAQQSRKDLQVLPEILLIENYAFALPEASVLREELNRNLLIELNSSHWQALLQKYFE